MHEPDSRLLGCPECGSDLEAFEDRSVMGTRCIKCDWCVVTTNRKLPIYDTNKYTVWAFSTNLDRSQLISKLAATLGKPIKDCIDIVDKELPIATAVHCIEVRRIQKLLSTKGISIRIEPKCPTF